MAWKFSRFKYDRIILALFKKNYNCERNFNFKSCNYLSMVKSMEGIGITTNLIMDKAYSWAHSRNYLFKRRK